MNPLTRAALLTLGLLTLSTPLHASKPWLQKVPARDHTRSNPLAGNPDAVSAGHLLYQNRCAQCHGANALGRGRYPSMRSDRVQQLATPGDLHWLLVNGHLTAGMPEWSKMPDPQLWQIVAYLKSLHQ